MSLGVIATMSTETSTSLIELVTFTAKKFGLNPALPDAEQIRKRDWREAIEFLNEHCAEGGIQGLDELEADLGKYRFAARYHECESRCAGLDACALKGFKPIIIPEDYFGKRFYAVRVTPCRLLGGFVEQAKTADLLKDSKIPRHLMGCTFENFRVMNRSAGTAKNQAMSAAEHGNSLVLMGDPGLGKTHLAVAIVRHVIAKARSARFAPVVTLLDEMRSAIDENGIDGVMRELRGVDCLVLDDIGVKKDTPWTGERLYELVNSRYNDQSQIIVTVNSSNLNDLRARIGTNGAQIESRLLEMGAVYCMHGNDYRKRRED
jgi:DNA replication protein DnaC